MAKYLLIESRDPFESNDVGFFCGLAKNLVKHGDVVTVFLVQNGVLAARHGPRSEALSEMAGAGVAVLADDFSLRERGIAASAVASGIKPASLEVVIDQLADGCKSIWH